MMEESPAAQRANEEEPHQMKKSPTTRSTTKPRTGRIRAARPSIAIKRVYDDAAPQDGLRILVDRLWPRGLSKAALKLDAWPRDLSPSTELRKWYGHDPKLFAEFRRRYRKEIAAHKDKLDELRAMIKGRRSTLLTATRELDLSHAVVLRELLVA
jgi:uncharacterized protein YeaO (DUF488 family)